MNRPGESRRPFFRHRGAFNRGHPMFNRGHPMIGQSERGQSTGIRRERLADGIALDEFPCSSR